MDPPKNGASQLAKTPNSHVELPTYLSWLRNNNAIFLIILALDRAQRTSLPQHAFLLSCHNFYKAKVVTSNPTTHQLSYIMKIIFASAILAVLSIAPGATVASVSATAAVDSIGRCAAAADRIGLLHVLLVLPLRSMFMLLLNHTACQLIHHSLSSNQNQPHSPLKETLLKTSLSCLPPPPLSTVTCFPKIPPPKMWSLRTPMLTTCLQPSPTVSTTVVAN